ncbi:MAG: chitobiase/beta-hexosaminidase C-terminal domain-containing protein [Bacteroidaceae bacterium]|nr:chitobiase/beta-hexosaminidase C-terminal domain-containing protein [Bacteroidaceae bacterium]
MLMMMTVGFGEMWADDLSGYYYIASNAAKADGIDGYTYNSSNPSNSYYLCPAIGSYWNNNIDNPYLTTNKTNQDLNSLWKIEAVSDETDCYYIVHYKTGKYLTSNETSSTNYDGGTNRRVVHLEKKSDATESADLYKFYIKSNSGAYQIYPKVYKPGGTLTDASALSLNVKGDNWSMYVPQNGQATGIIGVFAYKSGNTYNKGSQWFLESATNASALSATPIVKYSGENINISYPYSNETGITIHYSTDGTDPESGSTSTSTNFNISASGVVKVRAYAIKSEGVKSDEAVLWGSSRPFLIQSKENANYYLVPSGNLSNVNTSSIANEKMQWTLQSAGASTDGVPYYFLVNYNDRIINYAATNSITLTTTLADANKFCVIENGYGTGDFFLIPVSELSRCLFKKSNIKNLELTNGNVTNTPNITPETLKQYATSNGLDQWKLKACNESADQKNLFAVPSFNSIESESDAATYYNIQCVGNDTYYIVPPSTPNGYATTSNSDYANTPWMLKKATSDNWLTYYYIINAASLKYLYFEKDLNSTTTQSDVVSMKDISESTADTENRFQFAIVPSTIEDAYYIIPKGYSANFSNSQYYGLWRDDTNTSSLRAIWNRSYTGNNVKWKFENNAGFIAPPFISFSENDLKVEINSTTSGYTGIKYSYSKDGEAVPTSASTDYPSGGIVVKYGPVYHFAAKTIKESDESGLVTKDIDLSYIAIPTISENGNTVTFSNNQKGMTFYYTTNGSTPKYTDKNAADNHGIPVESNSEGTASVTLGNELYNIKVIAVSILDDANETGYSSSPSVVKTIDLREATLIHTLDGIKSQTGYYKCSSSFAATGTPKIDGTGDEIGTSSKPFKGTLEGYWDETNKEFKSISLSKPLFECVEDATIKNVIVASGNISGNGAIAEVAKGDARIYNCGYLGGTITGNGNVGGLVGELQGNARVINCYSFATVSGGSTSTLGGIVGNNNVVTASTKDAINTMVMNCMFYGNISGGTKRSPIYGGKNITNAGNLNGYNYYLYGDEAPYSKKASAEGGITDYNCALAAEKDFLTRFEFFRYTLNSNRELAAWYATGSTGNAGDMAKWVQDGTATYPILKRQGYYRSFINYDDAPELGSISLSYSGVTPKTGAPTSLTVYDKDLAKKHFNYRTVRLPYYCEVADDNYSGGVVTGWEITVMTGGTKGHFVTEVVDYSGTTHGTNVYPPYNFADRYCTDKDLFSISGRVFSQGAYFDVPEGVTGITIKPHKATNVAYLADPTYDVSYPSGYGQANAVFVSAMGTKSAPTEINGETLYTTFDAALNALGTASGSVYDNAIVLVGNYHHYWGQTSPTDVATKSFTIMSADFNNDCEPDYSFICQHGTNRQYISPIRFDFINSPGLGMVQKVETDNAVPKHGIWYPKGWFEVTNTTLIQFTQFEYDAGGKNAGSPLILLGGIYDQIVTSRDKNGISTQYIHLGSNIYMPMFSPGIHTASTNKTRHCPVSVTGGEFGSFYLTGMFRPDATVNPDNAECYINGGKFGEVAGAGQEQLQGDVTWLIDHADIVNFYGGGINGEKEITGHIFVEINNSDVGTYCGGPKFGNMHDDMTVTTNAKGTTFTKFFGAGYGGTSYNRVGTKDLSNAMDYSWDSWVTSDYPRNYSAEKKGIATEYEYEFIPLSGGESGAKAGFNVGRFYNKWASLSKAQTKNVITTLTDCNITTSFFGGGNLGRVDGTITTILKGCHVGKDVFGGGFSATAPTVKVFKKGAKMNPNPSYNATVGIINEGKYPTGDNVVEYTWSSTGSFDSPFTDTTDGKHYIYTDQDLGTLGEVVGAISLTIEDSDARSSQISGSVYGGGDASKSLNNTTVTLKGNTSIGGNVFGGGNEASVNGSATVNIE